jgi:hypothetical protein
VLGAMTAAPRVAMAASAVAVERVVAIAAKVVA